MIKSVVKYECPECGPFTVHHVTWPFNQVCAWCGKKPKIVDVHERKVVDEQD